MKKSVYNELKAKVEKLETLINGGPGSGFFGHQGRPGEVGGAAPAGSGARGVTEEQKEKKAKTTETKDKKETAIKEALKIQKQIDKLDEQYGWAIESRDHNRKIRRKDNQELADEAQKRADALGEKIDKLMEKQDKILKAADAEEAFLAKLFPDN